MTPGKLLSEIQVGGGSNGKYGLDRRAYRRANGEFGPEDVPDPAYWRGRLSPPAWASGTVIRYPFGLSDMPVFSPKHHNPPKHDGYFRNPFDQPFRFTLAEGTLWADEMYTEAQRAALDGEDIYWYHPKPGIGLYDSLALDIVKNLPGTHIVDATNGADGRPFWMPHEWWGEAWPNAYSSHGAYNFCRNVRPNLVPDDHHDAEDINRQRTAEANTRLRLGMAHAYHNNGRIMSCHEPEDFEWLMGDTVTKLVNGPADMPTWEILLKSGISLAFRGDEEKVNSDLGGRLSELKEVAG